jgi:hypothetical protein
MKKFILFAVAATMFAACANENDLAESTPQAANETDANLISFDAYMQRSTTRAGVTGDASTAALQTGGSMVDAGFGVFGYYTDNFDYTPLYVPNFMYNEQVKWQSTEFKYNLPKYWPNEHGSAATSADMDRVSFFAYLPWVNTDPATGMLVDGSGDIIPSDNAEMQYGITGMKRNSLQGDPTIQYVAAFDQAKCVDLCWGVVGSGQTWNTNSESAKTMTEGLPWLNVRKPDGAATDANKVKFTFKHALAQLDVTVKTDFTTGWEPTDETKTKVWVRSIRFTGIAKKAALNLNNPKAGIARWIDYYGTNELEMGESVIIYDGRKDGSEGVEGAEAINEAVLGLNPEIVQVEGQISDNAWLSSGAGVQPGVTSSETKLFRNNSAPATAVYVIPTGEKMNVEIVYDIETIDTKLPTMLSDGETHGSTIENRIIKQAVFNKLESGKKYTLNLILGLKDVKFNAEVSTGWTDEESSDAELPSNMPKFTAATSDADFDFAVPATGVTDLQVRLTGFGASETITPTKDGTYITDTPTGTEADAQGALVGTFTVPTNNTVIKKEDGWVKWSGSGKHVQLNIKQEPHALGLGTKAIAIDATEIELTSTATEINWSTNVPKENVKVTRNNTPLDVVTETPGSGQIQWDATNNKLILNSAVAADDTFIITIKAGDAAEESVTRKIPFTLP